MRILLAPQEFKGSLSANQVVEAMVDGVDRVRPEATIDRVPLADGGPGTVEAVVAAVDGRYSVARVEGPLGTPVDARWGRIADGTSAVIEMASASGLLLLDADQLDPRRAGTFGTGELIRAALDAGVQRILIGLGGSATNDGGAGMATALGARFLDDDGDVLPPGGGALARLARIDTHALDPRLANVDVVVLADVSNPLLGPDGASAIYGPQKGADAAAATELDRALRNYADIVARDLDVEITTIRGGGAAGGLGAGLVAFAGARIVPGIEYVAEAVDLRQRLAAADLSITGEGRLDRQSTFGKTVAGVAGLSLDVGTPCLAVGGSVDAPEVVRTIPGVVDLEAAAPPDLALAEAMANAGPLVADATARLLRRYLASLASTALLLVPADLVEPVVVDPKMVGNLVDDRFADLPHDCILITVADRLDRLLIDEDPVRQGTAVVAAAHRERLPLIEPEEQSTRADSRRVQLLRRWSIARDDHHVFHAARQLFRDRVQGHGDESAKAVTLHRGCEPPPLAYRGAPFLLSAGGMRRASCLGSVRWRVTRPSRCSDCVP